VDAMTDASRPSKRSSFSSISRLLGRSLRDFSPLKQLSRGRFTLEDILQNVQSGKHGSERWIVEGVKLRWPADVAATLYDLVRCKRTPRRHLDSSAFVHVTDGYSWIVRMFI
jgi:hypothetical protein